MGSVWSVLKMIAEIWQQILVLIGMVKKAEHIAKDDDISKGTAVVADPSSTEVQREEATKKLQDQINSHT